MFYGVTPFIFEKAKELREKTTHAENFLWEYLKEKKLDNLRFRRQHPIFQYIADFYCHEVKLVVELDGEVHESEENKKYDINRDYVMRNFEMEVLRFSNKEIFTNIEWVLNKIRVVSIERKSYPPGEYPPAP
jgi:very-short-patch-repair endonuclease